MPRNLPKSTLNLPNRHKNLTGQKRPKKPNVIWPSFKKKPKELQKAKNYKFGLKKVKLATLVHARSVVQALALFGLPKKQFLSSDGECVINFLACFSTSWARAFRAKLICVVSACTRAIYFPACFGQRLLAWRTCSPACTNSFCPNWSRLPHEGPPRRNFVTPQVNMLILGKLSFPIKN